MRRGSNWFPAPATVDNDEAGASPFRSVRPGGGGGPFDLEQATGAVYFRFASGLVLAVIVSLAGVGLEKRALSLRRQLSLQRYRMDVLCDRQARLRLRSERAAAPARLPDPRKPGRRTGRAGRLVQ